MKRDINVIGIDIAKPVLHVIGMDTRGTIILRKRLYRGEVMSLMAQLPRATVGREACGGAHYWARQCASKGMRSN
jgi:transposase